MHHAAQFKHKLDDVITHWKFLEFLVSIMYFVGQSFFQHKKITISLITRTIKGSNGIFITSIDKTAR